MSHSLDMSGASGTRRATVVALILILVAFVASSTRVAYLRDVNDWQVAIFDFDIFHLAGTRAWEGRLGEAYDQGFLAAEQPSAPPESTLLTWAYPPQFNLVTAGLATMPPWLAYLAFISATLAAYLLALGRLAGRHTGIVLLMVLPACIVTVRAGQNGFLTAALVGFFVLSFLRHGRWSGIPLGAMVIKPHLAFGVGVYLLLARRWGPLAQAAAVVAVSGLAATLAFGPGVWPASMEGIRESKAFLYAGAYQLQRMPSAYASLRDAGLAAPLALGGQVAVAVASLLMIRLALVQRWRPERTVAAAILASLLVSPYCYDYDLPLLGIALALVGRDLLVVSRLTLAALTVLAWVAAGYGYLATQMALARVPDGAILGLEGRPYAVGGFAIVAFAAILIGLLWRVERGDRMIGAPVAA